MNKLKYCCKVWIQWLYLIVLWFSLIGSANAMIDSESPPIPYSNLPRGPKVDQPHGMYPESQVANTAFDWRRANMPQTILGAQTQLVNVQTDAQTNLRELYADNAILMFNRANLLRGTLTGATLNGGAIFGFINAIANGMMWAGVRDYLPLYVDVAFLGGDVRNLVVAGEYAHVQNITVDRDTDARDWVIAANIEGAILFALRAIRQTNGAVVTNIDNANITNLLEYQPGQPPSLHLTNPGTTTLTVAGHNYTNMVTYVEDNINYRNLTLNTNTTLMGPNQGTGDILIHGLIVNGHDIYIVAGNITIRGIGLNGQAFFDANGGILRLAGIRTRGGTYHQRQRGRIVEINDSDTEDTDIDAEEFRATNTTMRGHFGLNARKRALILNSRMLGNQSQSILSINNLATESVATARILNTVRSVYDSGY